MLFVEVDDRDWAVSLTQSLLVSRCGANGSFLPPAHSRFPRKAQFYDKDFNINNREGEVLRYAACLPSLFR